VNKVFTPKECELTIDDIWAYIEEHSEAQRKDPESWHRNNWRNTGIVIEGIIGGSCIFTERTLENRQNPRLHKAFSLVLNNEKLFVNQDRYGLFRPTKGKFGKPEHATKANVHMDMNPWMFVEDNDNSYSEEILSKLNYKADMQYIIENNEVGVLNPKCFQLNVQGLVNLYDNKMEDGGFHLVPGFKNVLEKWAKQNDRLRSYFGKHEMFVVIPNQENVTKMAKRVTCRAGSAVLWDQRTLHGSRENNSENFRAAQFFKFFPALDLKTPRAIARAESIKKKISQIPSFKITDHGERVFGFKE